MKVKFLMFLLMAMVTVPVLADKPDWAGKGKPESGKERADNAKMKAKDYMDREHGESADHMNMDKKKDKGEKLKGFEKEKDKHSKSEEKMKMDKHDDTDLKGLEKQRMKKMEQEQKELGQGSEQGQENREQSKKWWKFWGE